MNRLLYSTSLWIDDVYIKRGSLMGIPPPPRLFFKTVTKQTYNKHEWSYRAEHFIS